MGSLSDALSEETKPQRRPCKVGLHLSTLDDEDQEAFDRAIGRTPHSVIHRALVASGLDCAYPTVQRHAYGSCGCFRG